MQTRAINVRIRQDQEAAMKLLIENDPDLNSSIIVRKALDAYIRKLEEERGAELTKHPSKRRPQ